MVVMQLVPGGQRAGRGETHALDASPQPAQGRGPVGVLPAVDRLEDQAQALLLSELKLADGLQHPPGEDSSVTCTMRLDLPFGGALAPPN